MTMPCSYTNRIGVAISVVSLYRFNLHFLLKIVQAVFYCCFIAVALMHFDAYAETGSPAGKSNTRYYDIPAGSLNTVLTRFISEAGIFFAGSTELAKGRHSPGVRGNLSVRKALDTLLIGTDLEAIRNAEGQYMLRPANAQTLTLPAMTISAEAEKDALPPPYAGGMIASGSRVGMLGNRDVMDTPFNQTSYTAELIENQMARTLADVLVNDPSIAMDSPRGSGWEGNIIRGFQQEDGTGSFSLNGLYGILPADASNTGMLERVEVLKGPSALLNGMPTGNAIGGSVNLVTKRAQDEPLTRFTASYASRSQFGISTDIGRRFGNDKAFGVRFNGTYRDGGLAIKPIDEERYSAVLGLDYRSERFRVSADIGHQAADIANANRPLFASNTAIPIPSPPRNDKSYLPPWTYWNTATTFGVVQAEVDVTRNITAYVALGGRYTDDKEVLFINPILSSADGDWTATPNLSGSWGKAWSGLARLRASLNTGPVHHALAFNVANVWLQGSGGAQNQSVSITSNIYDPIDIPKPEIIVGKPRRASETKRFSVGISDTMSLFDERIQLTVGVRRQEVESDNFSTVTGERTSGYDSHVWTPAYALVVKPLQNVSVYANYVEGLQPGTVVSTQFANAGQVFPPYRSKQYEAGIKVDWWGNLLTTLSIFQIAQPSTVQVMTQPLPTLELNGEQRNRGIELNLFGEPLPGVRLAGGAMIIDAELRKTQGGINDGNRAVAIPDWQTTVSGEWDVPFLPGLTLTGRVRHTGRVYAEVANVRTISSWTQLDAGARYKFNHFWNNKPAIIRLSVENLLDDNFWVARAFGLMQSQPRTVLLTATFDF